MNPSTEQWSELTTRPMSSSKDIMPVVDEVLAQFNSKAIKPYAGLQRKI